MFFPTYDLDSNMFFAYIGANLEYYCVLQHIDWGAFMLILLSFEFLWLNFL
jgi:hypothetical protein